MNFRFIAICILTFFNISSIVWANGGLSDSTYAPKSAFQELQCFIDNDKEPDILRLYHSQTRDSKEDEFESVAIFILKREGRLVPFYTIRHYGNFPGMLHVTPFDFDDDGKSEFVIETFSAGASHVYSKLVVFKLTITSDNKVTRENLFSCGLKDENTGAMRIEYLNQKGLYKLICGNDTFRLLNGKEQ